MKHETIRAVKLRLCFFMAHMPAKRCDAIDSEGQKYSCRFSNMWSFRQRTVCFPSRTWNVPMTVEPSCQSQENHLVRKLYCI